MKTICILLLACFLIGCAHFLAEEQWEIVTDQPNANVYLYCAGSGKKLAEGQAPLTFWIQRGLYPMKVVIEKEGYETISFWLPRQEDKRIYREMVREK